MDKLKELINGKHWTNKIASEKLGITERTLYGWIKGSKKPNWENVYKICDVFDCSLNDLNTSS